MKTQIIAKRLQAEQIEDPAGDILEIDDEMLSRISGAHGDDCSGLCSPCPPQHCV